jgi:excisionase family DNA binding protein
VKKLPALTMDEPIPRACTVADLARILNISRPRVYQLLAAKKMPFSEIKPRIGGPRFRGSDVELWLEGHYNSRRAVS